MRSCRSASLTAVLGTPSLRLLLLWNRPSAWWLCPWGLTTVVVELSGRCDGRLSRLSSEDTECLWCKVFLFVLDC